MCICVIKIEKVLVLLLMNFLCAGVLYADLPEPLIYLPFDGDWKNYGTAGTGEAADVWTGGDGSTPVLSAGFKGNAMDLTSATSKDTGCISWGSSTNTATSLQGLASFTITYWLNNASQPDLFNAMVLWDRESDSMQNYTQGNGQPRIRLNGSWVAIATDAEATPPTDGWYFLALTYDATVAAGQQTTKLYVSNPDPGETYAEALTELTLHASYDGTANVGLTNLSARSFIIGNRTLPHSASVKAGMDGMIDEFRIFGSTSDSSGVLDLEEIAGVMNLSLLTTSCSEYLPTDLNKDCYVTIDDLAIFFTQWLACSDEANPGCN